VRRKDALDVLATLQKAEMPQALLLELAVALRPSRSTGFA
jgi:hypothetical protein